MRLVCCDSMLSGALRPLVTRGDPRLGKRPCSLAESPYRPLYSHITRRPSVRLCCRRRRRRSRYHSSRPIYTRTQAPCRPDRNLSIQESNNQDTTSTTILVRRIPALCHSYLWPVSNQTLFAIYPFDPSLLQVRTATGRDSPDRYDNLIDLAPSLHRSQSFLGKTTTSRFFLVS